MGRGIGIGLGLNRGGKAGVAVPTILLSNSSIAENVANGTTIGTLSVINGSGTYTFTETADPDTKFGVTGTNLNKTAALDYETATSHSVTIHADNGAGSVLDRTFTITVTNVLEVTLAAITLSASTIEEASAPGTVVGAIQNQSSGSTLTLTDTAGGRFAISGSNIVAGSTATEFAVASSHNITIRETHPDASNTPRDSVIAITVTEISVGFSFSVLAQYSPSSITQSGGVVTGWTDTGPNGYHLNTVNGSPVYDATGIDSGPCIIFDGSNDWLESAAFDASGKTTIACFARVLIDSDAGTESGIGLIVNTGQNDYGVPNGLPILTSGSPGAGSVFAQAMRDLSDVSVAVVKGTLVTLGGVIGSNRTIYNMTSVASDTAVNSVNAYGTTSHLLVGARQYSSAKQNPFKGRINAMVWLDFAPDAGQRAEIQTWLESTPPF